MIETGDDSVPSLQEKEFVEGTNNGFLFSDEQEPRQMEREEKEQEETLQKKRKEYHKNKNAKLMKLTKFFNSANTAIRKRGRPRKDGLPPGSVPSSHLHKKKKITQNELNNNSSSDKELSESFEELLVIKDSYPNNKSQKSPDSTQSNFFFYLFSS